MSSVVLTQSAHSHWRKALLAIGIYILVLSIIYWPTLISMVSIWYRSGTFAHGFIIAPVSLWLIWQLRHEVSKLTPKPQPWFILPIVSIGMLWLMSSLVDVMVIQQLSFVFLLILGVCALLGTAVARKLMFPLAFLLFMVPMGENLIPPMMDFTASSTVWLIRHSGVPVYQEGLYFSLPSGNWSVVEACSGIRYLIASITLGCLYAYLTYTSMTKRLIFIAISIIVPILANSARAYLIVMIGHFSGMTLAVGVDHLVYGWLFFGIVIFLMFMIGSLFRDPPAAPNKTEQQYNKAQQSDALVLSAESIENTASNGRAQRSLFVASVMILASSIIWPLIPSLLPKNTVPLDNFSLVLPSVPDGWHYQHNPNWHWEPFKEGADLTHESFYRNGDHVIGLFINQYINQAQGSELVNGLDQWIIPELKGQQWHLLEQKTTEVYIFDHPADVEQARIKNSQNELLIWRWYRIGDYDTASPYVAKIIEALSKLTFQQTSSSRIYVVTSVTTSLDQSVLQVQSFMSQLSPKLEVVLSAQGEVH